MSDRPSTPSGPEDHPGPGPGQHPAPGPDAPTPADDTTVLPQQPVGSPDPAEVPTAATTQAQPYDPRDPHSQDAQYGQYGQYGGYGQAVPTQAAPAGPPPPPPQGWWGQATSTGGGKAALVTAGVLGAVLLLVGVGVLGGLVGRVIDGRHDRIALTQERSGRGWMDGPGHRGLDRDRGDQRDRGGFGPGMPGPRDGMGRGTAVLGGGVLHGEYTTTVNGTPTVMVVQTGEVRTYTSGRSLTVRSSDGFEATYSLDDSVVTDQVAARLVTGAQVRVVAAKEGMKVTRLAVVS